MNEHSDRDKTEPPARDERQQRYAETAVELLELDVRRAHDRMVADEVAAKFMAVADAEQAELAGTLTKVLDSLQVMVSKVARVEAEIERHRAFGHLPLGEQIANLPSVGMVVEAFAAALDGPTTAS